MKDRSLFAASLPLLAIAALCCAPSPLRADDARAPSATLLSHKSDPAKKEASTNAAPDKKDEAKVSASDKKEPKDELSETTNSVTINGTVVKYKATAGTLVIRDEEGKPHVSFFFVAYTRLDASNANTRPVDRKSTRLNSSHR